MTVSRPCLVLINRVIDRIIAVHAGRLGGRPASVLACCELRSRFLDSDLCTISSDELKNSSIKLLSSLSLYRRKQAPKLAPFLYFKAKTLSTPEYTYLHVHLPRTPCTGSPLCNAVASALLMTSFMQQNRFLISQASTLTIVGFHPRKTKKSSHGPQAPQSSTPQFLTVV